MSRFYILILLLFTGFASEAQIEVYSSDNDIFSPENLVRNIFLGEGVTVTDIQYDGTNSSLGYFNNADGDIGVKEGIVLSTGHVDSLSNANLLSDSGEATSGTEFTEDALLNLTSADIFDIARFKIKFVPASDTVTFKYVFGSEEYPEFTCSKFNDVFGFFISGPNPQGGNYNRLNIARVPDPNDPTGLTFTNKPVLTNSVNNGMPGEFSNGTCSSAQESLEFAQYYNDNNGGTTFSLDGYIDKFIALAEVVPCQEYSITIVIADGDDQIANSAVFLEANSFGTNPVNLERLDVSIDGSITEGCGSTRIRYSFPYQDSSDSIFIPKLIPFSNLPNQAEENIDFNITETSSLVNGNYSGEIILSALEDNILEGIENIQLLAIRDTCKFDTLIIPIKENIFEDFGLPDDVLLCDSSSYFINLITPPSYEVSGKQIFSSNFLFPINNNASRVESPINVTDVVPAILNEQMIYRVCVDSLEHDQLDDLDFFLVGPEGQLMALSSDNGYTSDSGNKQMISTCFSIDATININNGNANRGDLFSGNPTSTGLFAVEGDWGDLWRNENKLSNGQWRLLIIDDTPGGIGILRGWSIEFNPVDELFYEWTPNDGTIDCPNCQDVTVSPTAEQEYKVRVTDVYGCFIEDSIIINPAIGIAIPMNFQCSIEIGSDKDIRLDWEPVPGALAYEIRINEQDPWIPVNLDVTYLYTDSGFDEETMFEVRSRNIECPSIAAITNCTTPTCIVPGIVQELIENPNSTCRDNGRIYIEGSGNAPFTYVLESTNGSTANVSNTSGDFDNLPGGEYSLYIEDAIGCETSTVVTLTQDLPIVLSSSEVSPLACFGDDNAQITFDVSGGSGNYSFDWDGISSDSILSGRSVGIYNVTITDSKSCAKDTFYTLNEPPLLEIINPQSDYIDCFGDSSATASFTISGGTGSYNYQWNDDRNQTSATAIGLNSGNYKLTVTDENLCTVESSVDVAQNDRMIVAVNNDNIDCATEFVGSVSINVISGQGGYQYLWENGETTATISGISFGTYPVTITDVLGCELDTFALVSSPDSIKANEEILNLPCFGYSIGEIELAPSGGAPPYDYEWFDRSTTKDRSNLTAGSYCVTITDATGCSSTPCFEITQPDSIYLNALVLNETCAANNNGTIQLNPSGGTGNYLFSWTDFRGFESSDPVITDLIPGRYYVFVEDNGNQCAVGDSFDIEPAIPIVVTPTVANINCKGEQTGFITLNVSGGEAPLDYNWSGPGNYSSILPNIFDVFAGEYIVTITDGLNCEHLDTFLITEPATKISIFELENDTICAGSDSGFLQSNVIGGTGGYSYNWSNAARTDFIQSVPAGEYILTVTDDNNCESIDSAYVIELESFFIALEQDSAICSGQNSGAARIVSYSYGNEIIENGEYTYLWDSAPNQLTEEATNLIGGQEYNVLVTDKYGCETIGNIKVEEKAKLSLSIIDQNDPLCVDDTDGNITVAISNATEPITYVWNNRANGQTSSSVVNLEGGVYEVTATDINGCTANVTTVLQEPLDTRLDILEFPVRCFGENSGRLNVVASGTNGPFSYEWSSGSLFQDAGNLGIGNYSVTVANGNGCISIDSIELTGPEGPISFTVEETDPTCSGERDGILEILAFGGSGNYQYSLDDIQYNGAARKNGLTNGIYSIFVKDSNGCKDSLSDITLEGISSFELDLGDDRFVDDSSYVDIVPTITPADRIYNYLWSSDNPNLEFCDTCAVFVLDYIDQNSSVSLQVIDEYGCMQSQSIFIRVDDRVSFSVPTAFTPNGDGVNDVLYPYGKNGVRVESFSIYSRWGQRVYEINQFEVNTPEWGWNGTFDKKELIPDTYIWTATVKNKSGQTQSFSGETQLIR